jgi:hypothetical protein
MTVDMGAYGADEVTNIASVDACLDACVDGASVSYAMEFSQALGCWRHAVAFDSLGNVPGVTNYKPINCTAGE